MTEVFVAKQSMHFLIGVFRGSWRQKHCLVFFFFYSIFELFKGNWHILSTGVLDFLNMLLKSVVRLF